MTITLSIQHIAGFTDCLPCVYVQHDARESAPQWYANLLQQPHDLISHIRVVTHSLEIPKLSMITGVSLGQMSLRQCVDHEAQCPDTTHMAYAKKPCNVCAFSF